MDPSLKETHRCSRCDLNWPPFHDFERCPLCGAETWNTKMPDRLDFDQAKKHIKHVKQEAEAAEKYAAARRRMVEEFDAECDRALLDREVEKLRRELDEEWPAQLC